MTTVLQTVLSLFNNITTGTNQINVSKNSYNYSIYHKLAKTCHRKKGISYLAQVFGKGNFKVRVPSRWFNFFKFNITFL